MLNLKKTCVRAEMFSIRTLFILQLHKVNKHEIRHENTNITYQY